MKFLILLTGILALALIFLRRYLMTEKGVSFKRLLVRKKAVVETQKQDEQHEITVDEMLPPKESVDPAEAARAGIIYKKVESMMDKSENQDTKEVEKLLIQVLSMDPSSAEAHHKLGLIYMRQELFGKAEIIYRKLVVSLAPDPVYYSSLGLALYGQGKLSEAKMYYKKAVELDDKRAGRFYSLGQILSELGEHEEALKHFERAAELDPKNQEYKDRLST